MRLEVTRRSDLALRSLSVLAAAGRRMKANELASTLGSTPGFMPQVLSPLVERGWVRSDPGPTGGYRCEVPLDEVSVLEVIEAVEGPTDRGRCVLEDRPCGGNGPCALHGAWQDARESLRRSLHEATVASLPSQAASRSEKRGAT